MHVIETTRGAATSAGRASAWSGFALSTRERRALIAIADFVLGTVACGAAFMLHPGHLKVLPYLEPPLFGAIWVVSLLITDGYGALVPTSRVQSGIAVVRALPVAALLAVADFFFRPYVLNRPVILLALGIAAALLILARITVARLLLRESLAVRAVLLHDGEIQPELAAALREARFECRVAATATASADEQRQPAMLLQHVNRLLEETQAHQLIITSGELRFVPGLAEACLTRGVRVVSASDLVERYMGVVPLDSVDVHWYLTLPANDLTARPYAMVRRLADVVLALIAGIPFVVLFPFIALAIRLDSFGPIFIVQRRIGENGRQFGLCKLRTMTHDAESSGPQLAVPTDPRVTRVGRVLRATRLDEAPQMLNIIRGEMSFIGPRPERPEFVELFEKEIPHFRSRLLVKPGLTGWAQVKGGYASTLPEIRRKLEYDLYYIKNRSFRLDLQILSITLITVVGLRGR